MPEHMIPPKSYYLAYLFMAGLFLGILAVHIGHDLWITQEGILNYNMLEKLKNSMPEPGRLLSYIVKRRIFAVCMIGILSTTVIGIPIVYVYTSYLGLTAGCLLSVAAIRYGIRGLLLVLFGVIPHGFLLVPAYFLLFCWGIEMNRSLYGQGVRFGMPPAHGGRFLLKKVLQVIAIIVVVIIGCMVESYVNPKLLNFVLKLF